MEKKPFQAESRRLLDLMIHSIYTNQDIFLRELISNASDALDKRSFLALTDSATAFGEEKPAITITLGKKERTLTISDNGIGMSEIEMEKNLGTIASSGSLKFKQAHQGQELSELIGQFGVGFYSAFMVADKVAVRSRKCGEPNAHRWESQGSEGYTIAPDTRTSPGTDVILHIKADGEEKDVYSRYLREYPIWKLVKKYSDFIRYPILMLLPKMPLPGEPAPEKEEFIYETLNSMTPIWMRKKDEVPQEEYHRFYQEMFRDSLPPRSVLQAAVEGTVTYRALLFIPAQKSENPEKPGLQLYCNGVKIMEACDALLPECFSFIRGMVDSPDLDLNISRETLQQSSQLQRIRNNLESRILRELERMLKKERESYIHFYKAFGKQIKLCAVDDSAAKKETLGKLLLFHSSTQNTLVTLDEYLSRRQNDQKYIYYVCGSSIDAIGRLPQTELLREKQIEMLYFADKTDAFVPDLFRDYGGIPFRSVLDGDLELPGKKQAANQNRYRSTFSFVKEVLGDQVDEVIPSEKLKSHPVCLSSGKGITFDMERFYRSQGQNRKAQRILELNVEHPAFAALEHARLINPEKAKKYVWILFNQANLIAGLPLEDPTAYTDLLCSLW